MKSKKSKGPRKGSITATVIGILSRAFVPSDDAIVGEVKGKHKGSKFKKSHLAWYKSKFRVGGLTGMGGKRQSIAQKQAPKKTKKARPRKGLRGLKPKKKV